MLCKWEEQERAYFHELLYTKLRVELNETILEITKSNSWLMKAATFLKNAKVMSTTINNASSVFQCLR